MNLQQNYSAPRHVFQSLHYRQVYFLYHNWHVFCRAIDPNHCWWYLTNTLTEFELVKLLQLNSKNTTFLEYPSMLPCIAKLQRMRDWWSSKCHKEFGHCTKCFPQIVTRLCLSAVFLGSNLIKTFRIHDLWTRIPRLLIYPAINVWPVVRLWPSKYSNIRKSSSSFLTLENLEVFCYWNLVTSQWIVHCNTPNIFEIFFHKKPIPRSFSRVSAGMLSFHLSWRPFVITTLLPQNVNDGGDLCRKILLNATILTAWFWSIDFI